jgi:hypothetical protein
VSLLLAASAAQISVRLAGVLKGEFVQMGRDGRTRTVALEITNESKDADAFILLFGESSAFDDGGGTLDYRSSRDRRCLLSGAAN